MIEAKKFFKWGLGIGIITFSIVPYNGAVFAQSMDYSLLEDLFQEPVTTSANGKPQRVSDVAVNMEIITAQDIERSGSTTLPGILKSVAGIDYIAYNFSHEEVSIRGYNQSMNPRLLVMVNGRQVYANFFGFVEWSGIPVELDEIRQIEIVKGPNTALFGFNAASGVINIITYNPLFDDKISARIGLGTDGLIEASGVATLKLSDKAGLRFSSGYREIAPYSRESNPAHVNNYNDAQSTRGALEGLFQINDNVQIALETSGSNAVYENILSVRRHISAEMDTKSVKTRLEANTPLGLIKLSAYNNWMNFEGIGSVNPIINESFGLFQAEVLNKVDEKNTIRLATEYRQSSVESSYGLITRTPDHTLRTKVFSLSGLWDSQFSAKFSTSVSVRWDHEKITREGYIPVTSGLTNEDYNVKKDEFSYNLGLTYKLWNAGKLRATTARGIQMPSPVDFSGIIFEPTLGGITISGNPHLEPLVIINYELGYEHSIKPINGKLKFAVFHQINKNISSSAPTRLELLPSNVLGNQKESLGDSRATGFEIELEGITALNVRWGINYSYVEINDDLANYIDGELWFSKEFENQSPKHHFNVSAGYDLNHWSLDLQGHYVSSRNDLTGQGVGLPYLQIPIENTFLLDGRLSYKVSDHISVDIKGTNLLKSETRLSDHGIIERRIFGQLRASF